jgi:pseudoazurin
MKKLLIIIVTSLFSTLGVLNAAEIEVKMLNKGSDGEKMVFEPALVIANVGDVITFLPTEKGHMAASIKGMIPEGAASFKGKTNKTISYEITTEGLYAFRCTPHYANGMVGIIAVGNNLDKDSFLAEKKISKKSKDRFEQYLSMLP